MNVQHYWCCGYHKPDQSQVQMWWLFTLCAVYAHKRLSLSSVIEWCLVSVLRGGVFMQAIKLRMNNAKLRHSVAYPGNLKGGVQQIQLRTKDRENGDLGVVAP